MGDDKVCCYVCDRKINVLSTCGECMLVRIPYLFFMCCHVCSPVPASEVTRASVAYLRQVVDFYPIHGTYLKVPYFKHQTGNYMYLPVR